jgi:phenylalanyl-tRNA synthetase beta chain
MKVSLKWLKEYVDITLPPADLAERLTMAGLEVKGMEVIGGSWDNIVVGQILAVNRHPNAEISRWAIRLPLLALALSSSMAIPGR